MARAPAMQVGKKKCPQCAETVKAEAKACRHCGYQFTDEEMRRQAAFEAETRRRGWIGLAVIALCILVAWSCLKGIGFVPSIPPRSVASAEPDNANAGGALKRLPAADRFTEFPDSHPLRAAQDALNAGDPTAAADIYLKRDRSRDDAQIARFNTVLDKAWHQQTGDDPTADFADRIETYWLPAVAALAVPQDDAGWTKLIMQIDELSSNAADGEKLALSRAQKATGRRYLSALGMKQAQLFPLLRRHIRSTLASTWFREDIEVTVAGPRADTIRLTAPGFVRNAAIEDLQRAAGESFLKARFRRVEYRWSPHWNEGHHFDLKPPADTTVAVWDAASASFHTVRLR